MGEHQPDPFTHDPATLRAVADEADGHRYQTTFGRLDDRALFRAMAAALRALPTGWKAATAITRHSGERESRHV